MSLTPKGHLEGQVRDMSLGVSLAPEKGERYQLPGCSTARDIRLTLPAGGLVTSSGRLVAGGENCMADKTKKNGTKGARTAARAPVVVPPKTPEPSPAKLRTWPVDRIERRALGSIIPYPRNAMFHSDAQIAQLAASMKRYGVTTPILVDEDGVIIYGHGRLRAARLLAAQNVEGFETLPVAVAEGWSEEDKRGYRIADNQLARLSEWDVPALKAELTELQSSGYDLSLVGFPEAKLVAFMAVPKAPENFPGVGENIKTDYCCPACQYKWSGSPNPGKAAET